VADLADGATGARDGRIAAISVDYSDDELDAIAELFRRPDLGGRRVRDPGEDVAGRAAARAAIDAATRGLVARRAIALEGTAVRPRVRFLEPHATLLGAFVGADATASVRVERPGRTQVRALFARADVVVEQASLPGQAIKRMVAHPRGEALRLLFDDLPCAPEAGDDLRGRVPHELTLTMLDRAERVLEQGSEPPSWLSSTLLDLLHARTGSATIVVRRRHPGGIVLADRISWMAAGTLGTWRVEPVGTTPSVTVRLAPTTDDEIRRLLTTAWEHEAAHRVP
jgi:hypothetical protein